MDRVFPSFKTAYYFILCVTTVYCGWFSTDEQPASPIVLWWTSFTGTTGELRTCGEETCFFTENRTFLSNNMTKVVSFYGSSFSPVDLPIPRESWHQWALLHEESPKNNPSFCHESLISIFNYTATWSRKSSFPLTLLSLPSIGALTDSKHFIPVAEKNRIQIDEGLSPIVYVQSSCDAPSERDAYILELQKYINIDSYGKCLNNKQLPEHLKDPAEGMNHDEFLLLMAKYKFTIAFENAIGSDYITEKLWRPLILGSVPIYMGSPSIQDWIPDENSIVSVSSFPSPQSLAAHIHAVDQDDEAYNRMLLHKVKKTISNLNLIDAVEERRWTASYSSEDDFDTPNFVEAFECFLCSEMHRKQKADDSGFSRRRPSVDTSHYNCSPPIHPVTKQANHDNWWVQHWNHARAEANVIGRLVMRNQNYSSDEFHEEVFQEISSELSS